ncbi:phosphonoacetaldehyde hydrolase [Bradyrhizobium sp. UFLA05-109]
MTEKFERVRAVVFDWAGTIVDHGSLAPMGVFVTAFARFGVEITIDEARAPMGMAKRPHIATLMRLPRVAAAWRDKHGREPTEADIDAVYEVFVPMNVEVAGLHADVIPGAAEAVAELRQRGVKIGSSTGYTRDIMAKVIPIAAAQGYSPDCIICTGDTPDGRPTPFMLYKAFLELAVWPAWACVKVDDTEVGIAEGLNGGCWTVGVAVTGNVFGLSLADTAALSSQAFAARRTAAANRLEGAGAHYVIDSVADIFPVIEAIEERLTRGERP